MSYSFVMTKDGGHEGTGGRASASPRPRCEQCRRVLPAQTTGRPRKFCSQACRQWHWVGQQRARELQLSDQELVVTRAELDAIHDELYVLACAVDDVDRDLATLGSRPPAAEVRRMLDWLLDAARPLRERELGRR